MGRQKNEVATNEAVSEAVDFQAENEVATNEAVSEGDKKNKNTKDIPQEVLNCVGKKFIIYEARKDIPSFQPRVSMLADSVFDLAYENAVVSHGSNNVRAFICTKDNVAELYAILKKYKNGIIKA